MALFVVSTGAAVNVYDIARDDCFGLQLAAQSRSGCIEGKEGVGVVRSTCAGNGDELGK